jgi:hypothetical protein
MRDLQERFQFASLIGAGPTQRPLRLKSLSPASTVTLSNFHISVNTQRFSAPNERKLANVKCV